MARSNLHDGWRLRAVGGPVPEFLVDRDVPAQVPGSTHLDLMAADLIPDPYLDRNEVALTWLHASTGSTRRRSRRGRHG